MDKFNVGSKKVALLYMFIYLGNNHYFNDLNELRILIGKIKSDSYIYEAKFDLDSIPKYYTSHKEWLKTNI